MRAHILEDQVAEFPGAIAGELSGRHQPAGQRRSQGRRMRDLDRDLLFSMGVTAHNEKPYGSGHASNHTYPRDAGPERLSARSTDHAPDPAIMIAAAMASAST